MAVFKTLVALVVVASVATAAIVEVPDEELLREEPLPAAAGEYIPKLACPRKNQTKAAINSCIRNNMEALLPEIKKAGKYGLPDLEPYEIPELITDFRGGPINIHVSFSNMTVAGLTNAIVRDARADLRDDYMKIELDLIFPKLIFNAAYKLTDGIFASWTFTGHGPVEVTFRNARATWTFEGKKKVDEQFMTMERVDTHYTVGGMKFWAKGLVDGYPAVDDIAILTVNRLWREVVELGKPFVQKPIVEHLTKLSSAAFSTVPYETLFPKEG